jgi:hypothetical protein
MLASATRTMTARAAPVASPPSIKQKSRSPAASLGSAAPCRAPRTLRIAARAAAGGKAYICK